MPPITYMTFKSKSSKSEITIGLYAKEYSIFIKKLGELVKDVNDWSLKN